MVQLWIKFVLIFGINCEMLHWFNETHLHFRQPKITPKCWNWPSQKFFGWFENVCVLGCFGRWKCITQSFCPTFELKVCETFWYTGFHSKEGCTMHQEGAFEKTNIGPPLTLIASKYTPERFQTNNIRICLWEFE